MAANAVPAYDFPLNFTVLSQNILPGGRVMLECVGYFPSNYQTGGCPANLANYILSSDYPSVIVGMGDGGADGAVFSCARNTATNIKIKGYVAPAYTTNASFANYKLAECAATADYSACNVSFIAIGMGIQS